ncbi:MAG: hypothetical protein ACOVP3_02720 [Rhodoluna sp.]
MNLVLKKLVALTSATALLSAGLVGITASAANAASAPLTVTFEDDDTTGYQLGSAGEYIADFEGNESSLEASLPGGRTGKGAKMHIKADAQPWSGTTILKTDAAAVQDGTLFSVAFPYADIDVYSTVAGDMMLKMEGGCAATEIKVAHAGTGWETLRFENGSLTGCTMASFFPLFFVNGRQNLDVYIDNASFPGAATPDVVVPVTAPSTLLDFEGNNAFIDFGGAVSSTTATPAGAAAGNSAKIVAGGECWAGVTLVTASTTNTMLSAGNTSVTANVYVPTAGASVRMKLENSGNGDVFVEKDASASMAGWNRLTWDFSNYDASKVYNKVSVFPGFSCVDAGNAKGDYYIDDVAFNGAVTPKLPAWAKITSSSKRVVAVTVGNARGQVMTVTIHGVRTFKMVIPSSATRTFKFNVGHSGVQKVTVTIGTMKMSKKQDVK